MMVSRKLRWLVLSGILLGTCGLPGFSEAADAGMHVDQVMATVPKDRQCTCRAQEPKKSGFMGLFG